MKKYFIFLLAVILMLSGCGNAAAPQNEGEVTVSKEMLVSEEESEEQGSEKTENSEEITESSESAEESQPEEESSEASVSETESAEESIEESSGEEEKENSKEQENSGSKESASSGSGSDKQSQNTASSSKPSGSQSASNTGGQGTSSGGTTNTGGSTSQPSSTPQPTQTPQPEAHVHTYVTQTVSEATCLQPKKVHDVCTGCGDVQNERNEGNPLGHDYQGFTVWREATCTTAGYVGGTCTRCGATESTGCIPVKPHEYEATVTMEGDCNGTPHIVQYTCKNCGSFYEETDWDYHANDHVWVTGPFRYYDETQHAWVETERTYCSVCNRDKD